MRSAISCGCSSCARWPRPGTRSIECLRINFAHLSRDIRRNRSVVVGDHQQQFRRQPRQIMQQRFEPPVRHHPQCGRDMSGTAHQLSVQRDTLRIDGRTGIAYQPLDRTGIRRLPGEHARHQRIHHQQFCQRREQMIGDAAERHERAVEADQKPRRDFPIKTHPRQDCRAGGMSDHDLRLHSERAGEAGSDPTPCPAATADAPAAIA